MRLPLLGGLDAAAFLARYWQKRPLLVRAAIPDFAGIVSRADLIRLATRDDAETRLVARRGRQWTLRHGPFAARDFANLPARQWTLLVQGLNHFIPAADALLSQFDFIPRARLDDVMVSYAVPGGGVGPHFDSYDVFLLQGPGRRRWRIGAQKDHELDPRAPLKILKRFDPEFDWVLEPGDMLYLPPGYAHDGIAVDECMTYSIGFRASPTQELAVAFLRHLEDTLDLDGRYADPDLEPQRHPAAIGDAMVEKAAAMLARVRWNDRDVARFLGQYLSEPKATVTFSPPRRPLSAAQLNARCRRYGLRLSRRTIMLFRGGTLFINGEAHPLPAGDRRFLVDLADRRSIATLPAISSATAAQVYDWYRAGYLMPGDANE